MCEVSVAHQILPAADKVGLAVGQHVEAVGDIRHMAVHMVGQENAFRRFFLPDQRLERRHMQRGNLRKRFVEQSEQVQLEEKKQSFRKHLNQEARQT